MMDCTPLLHVGEMLVVLESDVAGLGAYAQKGCGLTSLAQSNVWSTVDATTKKTSQPPTDLATVFCENRRLPDLLPEFWGKSGHVQEYR
jgi:hypothetical protein